MKLYSFALSPYAARVRISIYAKKLPIEIVAPPAGGIKSDEFRKLNPLGRVPVLVTDEGAAIPESETIVEYLEDAYPDPPLRPQGAEARARVRLIARVAEIYVLDALRPIFNSKVRTPALVEAQLAMLREGMAYLESFIEGPYAAGEKFTTADCEVTPVLFFVTTITGELGLHDYLQSYSKLTAYYAHTRTDPVLAKVLDEMAEGLKAWVD